MRGHVVVATAALVFLGLTEASAQSSRARTLFRPRSFEIDVGGAWQGRVPLGATSAPLTGNQGPPSVDLFDVDSQIDAFPSFDARLAFRLTRAFAVEGGFRYAQPKLATRITADFEDAPDITAVNSFSQYAFELNGVLHLNALRFGRSVPFIFGGGGYLRELYSGREIVETGQTIQAGIGIKQLLRRSSRGLIRSLGVRADARFYGRRKGVELEEDEPLRTYGAASAALIVGF
jgi:hypothetical protein